MDKKQQLLHTNAAISAVVYISFRFDLSVLSKVGNYNKNGINVYSVLRAFHPEQNDLV